MINSSLISKVGEIFTPLLKESIIETGRITPEEFIISGDNLTKKCPAWSWAGVPSQAQKESFSFNWPLGFKVHGVSYLPSDKQFLISKRVLCLSRACSSPDIKEEKMIYSNDEFSNISSGESLIFDIDPERHSKVCEIQPCRKYDISITYDKFYQVPRIWLFGYSETDSPLTPDQIYEDISAEHARKTVTIDRHPFLPFSMASIHPCKHASVISSMIKVLKESNEKSATFPPEQYLLCY